MTQPGPEPVSVPSREQAEQQCHPNPDREGDPEAATESRQAHEKPQNRAGGEPAAEANPQLALIRATAYALSTGGRAWSTRRARVLQTHGVRCPLLIVSRACALTLS